MACQENELENNTGQAQIGLPSSQGSMTGCYCFEAPQRQPTTHPSIRPSVPPLGARTTTTAPWVILIDQITTMRKTRHPFRKVKSRRCCCLLYSPKRVPGGVYKKMNHQPRMRRNKRKENRYRGQILLTTEAVAVVVSLCFR